MVQFRLLATLFGISNGKCGTLSPPHECQCEKSFDDVSAKNNELGFPGPSARVTSIEKDWYNAWQVPHCESSEGCHMDRRVKTRLTKAHGFEADANADLGLLSVLNIAIKQYQKYSFSMTVGTEEDFEGTCDNGWRCDYRLTRYTVHYEWCRVDSNGKKICDCTGYHEYIDSVHSELCQYKGLPLESTEKCPTYALRPTYALQQGRTTTCKDSFDDNYLGFGTGGKGRVDNVQKINDAITLYEKYCGKPLESDKICPIHKEYPFESRQTEEHGAQVGVALSKSIGKMAASKSGFASKDFVYEEDYIFDHPCLQECTCIAMAAELQVILNWCKYTNGNADCSCWDTVKYTDFGVVSFYDDRHGKECTPTKTDDKPQFVLA